MFVLIIYITNQSLAFVTKQIKNIMQATKFDVRYSRHIECEELGITILFYQWGEGEIKLSEKYKNRKLQSRVIKE